MVADYSKVCYTCIIVILVIFSNLTWQRMKKDDE